MALTRGNWQAKLAFTHSRAASGLFAALTAAAEVAFSLSPDLDTYDFVHTNATPLVIAGGGSTTIDLFATLTDRVGNTKAGATKLGGYIFVTTGVEATASLKVSPGASNPAPIGLSSSSPAAETPSHSVKAGGVIVHVNPTHETLSTSLKNVLLANPGSTSLSVVYAFFLGGGTNGP